LFSFAPFDQLESRVVALEHAYAEDLGGGKLPFDQIDEAAGLIEVAATAVAQHIEPAQHDECEYQKNEIAILAHDAPYPRWAAQ